MKHKLIACLMTLIFSLPSLAVEIYQDKSHGFTFSYTADWEFINVISATTRYSLASKQRTANSRPYATFKVDVSEVDQQISLEKYIRNNVKIASVAWKVIEEKSLVNITAENVFFLMQHKIGNRNNKVQRLVIKANGKVYDVSCAMIESAESSFDKACSELIAGFNLLPK